MNIISREEWGAVPPTHTAQLDIPTRDLILHHAGSSGGGARRVRAIQRFHMESRGWSDIAYHYLIDSDGTIYEGRGAGIRGGATFGQNATSHAICLLGNFDREEPAEAALQSLVELIQIGHPTFWPDEITGGHRDFRSTSCPGDNLYARISKINDRVKEEMVDRNSKADDGLPSLRPNFDEMVAAGVFSAATQPGGVTFNDEFATFLIRFENYIKAKYGLGQGDGDGVSVEEVKQLIRNTQLSP